MKTEEVEKGEQISSVIEILTLAFVESDAGIRDRLLEEVTVKEICHWSRQEVTNTRQDLSKTIGAFIAIFNDLTIKLTSEVQTFRDIARVSWEVSSASERWTLNQEFYFEFAAEGRLKTIVNFGNFPHYQAFAGGAQAYVDAWNSNSESERYAALVDQWRADARWVEIKFDVVGPQAIAKTMNSVIHLTPLGGIMDVIHFDGVGSQVCFQIEGT